jgi:hypothetical protein
LRESGDDAGFKGIGHRKVHCVLLPLYKDHKLYRSDNHEIEICNLYRFLPEDGSSLPINCR